VCRGWKEIERDRERQTERERGRERLGEVNIDGVRQRISLTISLLGHITGGRRGPGHAGKWNSCIETKEIEFRAIKCGEGNGR